MPSATVLIAFIGTCVVLALTPGPNMSLIIANTISGGLRAGLLTLAGAGTGLAILVTIAALGMTSVMTLMADWFDVVRWRRDLSDGARGAAVLGWWRSRGSSALPVPPRLSGALYAHGLAVSLSNPKVLLFLGAFLPQFIDPAQPPGPQLLVLAVLFMARWSWLISATRWLWRGRGRHRAARLRSAGRRGGRAVDVGWIGPGRGATAVTGLPSVPFSSRRLCANEHMVLLRRLNLGRHETHRLLFWLVRSRHHRSYRRDPARGQYA